MRTEMELKDKIRSGMAGRKLTQVELAMRLSVTIASVSRWVNGHAKPHNVFIAIMRDELKLF